MFLIPFLVALSLSALLPVLNFLIIINYFLIFSYNIVILYFFFNLQLYFYFILYFIFFLSFYIYFYNLVYSGPNLIVVASLLAMVHRGTFAGSLSDAYPAPDLAQESCGTQAEAL